MKISETLWVAANKYLNHMPYEDRDKSIHSCDAISMCLYGRFRPYRGRVFTFLRSMGLEPRSSSQFIDVPIEKRQGARYAWLMFASMYAEELGL